MPSCRPTNSIKPLKALQSTSATFNFKVLNFTVQPENYPVNICSLTGNNYTEFNSSMSPTYEAWMGQMEQMERKRNGIQLQRVIQFPSMRTTKQPIFKKK